MQAEEHHQGQLLLYVPVDAIQPPSFELRVKSEDANDPVFQEFCNSIHGTGIVEPLIVRPMGKSKYELVAGGRRLTAAILAGLKEVPVIVKPTISDIDAKILAISENLHRKDLSPIEKSRALIALYQSVGYPAEVAAKYLMRLDEDRQRGEAKRADAIVVPHNFKEIYKKLGLGANRQWQLIKFAVLDEEVLEYAKQKGLNGNKLLLLTRKGIVERGVDIHKRIIDRISNMSEWDARQYVHLCSYTRGRRKKQQQQQQEEQQRAPPCSITFHSEKYGEVGLDIVDTTTAQTKPEEQQEQDEDEGEDARPSRDEVRYAKLARNDKKEDNNSSRPPSSLAYLTVHDLCLPADFMLLLRKRATLNNCDVGQYLTYILLYKLQRSKGCHRTQLSPREKAWFMSKNKGCATVNTEKEKAEG